MYLFLFLREYVLGQGYSLYILDFIIWNHLEKYSFFSNSANYIRIGSQITEK